MEETSGPWYEKPFDENISWRASISLLHVAPTSRILLYSKDFENISLPAVIMSLFLLSTAILPSPAESHDLTPRRAYLVSPAPSCNEWATTNGNFNGYPGDPPVYDLWAVSHTSGSGRCYHRDGYTPCLDSYNNKLGGSDPSSCKFFSTVLYPGFTTTYGHEFCHYS